MELPGWRRESQNRTTFDVWCREADDLRVSHGGISLAAESSFLA
jgi:hypothetical protein